MVRYGRCMSKQRAKKLKKTGILEDSGGGLIPVFDSHKALEDRLRRMSGDQLRNYFKSIGVRNPQMVAFFDISENKGMVGPIPQTNGLREYKIPQGTRVDEYSSIRI